MKSPRTDFSAYTPDTLPEADVLKPSSSKRAFTLYIISVLKKYSDKDHPMTIHQIEEKLQKTFFDKNNEKGLNNSTVRRNLEELLYALDDSEYALLETRRAETALNLGFFIRRVIRNADGSFCPYTKDPDEIEPAKRASKSPTLYFYYQSVFEDAELLLMINSLEAYNYLCAEDTAVLVSKLAELSPCSLSSYLSKDYRTRTSWDPRINSTFAYILENLTILRDAIQKDQFVNIVNCYYAEDHKLKPFPNNDIPKMVRPLRLMFNNGFYYLIAVEYSISKNKYFPVHYRVDRLGFIEPFTPSPKQRQDFYAAETENLDDAALYRLQHPIMYGDHLIHVHLKARNTPQMLNVLMDTFGTVAAIQKLDDDWLSVKTKASFGGIRLFATEYCSQVRILSPDDLIQKVREDLKTGFDLYQS